ncbi:hypothetical protein LL912_00805 [Niabella sp. CC-SYL272]|uniref:hypothetical protein n=1 Tax=Niabella agricola TaxID=2891571 RepID=UPI001F2D26D1|nr:hypothetical protein [Niabella agricola]MCF3107306.1 hypothetical protein [Niabella agricola]
MTYNNSDELCQIMAERQKGVTLLRFSCGKDAIASYIQLKRYFHTIIPIYHYLHPDLDFVNDSLVYYEEVMGTHIYRVPNQMLYKHLNSGLFQDLHSWNAIKRMQLPNFDNDEVNVFIKEDLGLDPGLYTAIGVRAADSLNRRRSIKMHGAVNHNRLTFFPVYDWNMEKLTDEIQQSGIKLPVDYKIWGKSFDGLDFRFIKPLKDNFPNDYEKLKQLFPLINVELQRYGY